MSGVTLDEYNRHWFIELSSARDLEHLARLTRCASADPLWNGKLAKHAAAVMTLLLEGRGATVMGKVAMIRQVRNAPNLEQLGTAVTVARYNGLWDPAVDQAYKARQAELRSEDAVRADERLKVLREVRNAAAQADDNCDERPGRTGDPYGWGYGGSKIVAYLSWLLGEQRRAMGLEPPRG